MANDTAAHGGVTEVVHGVGEVRGWLAHPAEDTGVYLADEADGWDYRSYRELADEAWSVAARLRAAGVAGGDGACVIMPTSFAGVATFYAVWACGAVFTPITPPTFGDMDHYVSHVAEILRQAGPRVVATSAELADPVRRAMVAAERIDDPLLIGAPEPVGERQFGDPGECALLQFTSGSTGAPRGVRVSWRNLASNVAMISELVGWRPGDAMASWLPLYHDMGLVGAFFTTVTNQGNLYLMRPDQFVRDPMRWLRAMTHAQHSPSPSFALGYVAHRVSHDDVADLDLSGWRTLAVGSEPVEVADLHAFAELTGPQGFSARAFTLAYGLAEATLMVTSSDRDRPLTALRLDNANLRFGQPVRVVSQARLDDGAWVSGPGWITGLGHSTPGSQVTVVDEGGRELPDGTLGEMVVCGDSVALGYTESASGGTRLEDGRLYTGDAGFRYDGEVFVLGRMGSSLKVRGRSVFMEDIEARVARETGITKGKLAAVAVTDAGTQGIALFAETAPGAWIEQARSIVRAALGPAQTATVVTGPRGCIRRTSSGKPRRRHMWQLFRDGGLDGAVVHDDEGHAGAGGSGAAAGAAVEPVLPDTVVHRLLDRALDLVAVPDDAALLFEGSLAEGFGNAGSDVDFLAVVPGDDELPTLPTVLFIDGRRVEMRTRSVAQLRGQLERVAARSAPDEDVLNRCQRFLRATVMRAEPGSADIDALRSLLPYPEFGAIVGDWWAERARQALRYGVAMNALGERDEALAWARDGLLQAVKAWAARRGETYLETKWLPEQLARLDAPESTERYRAASSAALPEILDLAEEFGITEVTDDPGRVVLARVPGVTTWSIAGRVHVLRGERDVFVLSERAARAWRSVVLRRSLREIIGRAEIGVELAEFVRLGLVGLQWRGSGTIAPALAMCKPVQPYSPVPGRATPALGVTGAAREPSDNALVTLSPLPAERFTACALDLVWSNVVLENAREDLVGALDSRQGAVADISAHRIVAMCVRMIVSAYGIHPMPADVAPAATLARVLPDATGRDSRLVAAVAAGARVEFERTLAAGDEPVDELATLDDLVSRVRGHVGGTDFPASFDSREQWRRTLDISYDWLRVAGYLDTDLPIDEARDLLTSGGRQPHAREGGTR